MAIKRVTIHIDDSLDVSGSTSPPESLVTSKSISSKTQSTSTPEEQDDYGVPESLEKDLGDTPFLGKIGRTPSDLVFAFSNRPQFMATIITFLAFFIFVGKLNEFVDFWRPALLALIINSVWFGIPVIGRIISKRSST